MRHSIHTVLAVSAAVAATLVTGGATGARAGTPGTPGTPGTGDGTTRVVLPIEDCHGCRVQVYSGLATDDPAEPRLWASLEKRVRDGKVAFAVPSSRTPGMSVVVRAPWEGHTGYDTTVVFRYAGLTAGEHVDTEVARTKHRASGCFEGTSRDKVTLPVVVSRVQVPGVHGPVAGTLAHLATTTPWLAPMRRVHEGVLGSQDVTVCR
ncbi:hypothetical protein I601_2789 [Nocardioides dokdonensis FR1436]|uniref:Uncharacterized protein n=1 Tax=Nocardioides dokdonensis FR1436 TaxID=1300347 RepID=A0A1A9GP40_9ACTN|nr:hypothetical protein [Nocardioides dokdonensis]ANH39205.1 hypothetical protein I601_2789 [Nocardioides dokdonensis FR1436]